MPTAPDPNALRRDRKDDPAWTRLTPRDPEAVLPPFPLAHPTPRDLHWWSAVWAMPQANEWEKAEEEQAVALYVRLLARSEEPAAPITAMRPLMQLREELGLSVTGRRRRRWLMPGEQTGASTPADRLPGRAALIPITGGGSGRSSSLMRERLSGSRGRTAHPTTATTADAATEETDSA